MQDALITAPKKVNYYDEEQYDEFWIGRDYEHLSEIIALKHLLKGRHFKVTLDYGGGYGRLTPLLARYSDQIILADPSSKMLDMGKEKLVKLNHLKFMHLKEDGKIPLDDSSLDLIVMIRVSHHLTNPVQNFNEINRVLKIKGIAIIEVANSAHMLNRLKNYAKFKSVPKEPIMIGDRSNGIIDDTPFLNHNIKTIEKQLKTCHLRIINKLSVSNLRSQFIKKHLKLDNLLAIEKYMQPKFTNLNFGPSIFLLVEKVKD